MNHRSKTINYRQLAEKEFKLYANSVLRDLLDDLIFSYIASTEQEHDLNYYREKYGYPRIGDRKNSILFRRFD